MTLTTDEILERGAEKVRALGLNPDRISDWERAVSLCREADLALYRKLHLNSRE